jgi:hypothetical protein
MFRVFAIAIAGLLIIAGALPPPPQELQAQESAEAAIDRISNEAASLQEQKPATAPEVAGDTFRDPSWTKAVYQVRVLGDGGVQSGGTAVAVRKDALHTAKHIGEGLRRPRYEINVAGTWRPAVASPFPGKDLAVLTVSGVTLDYVPVRVPVYGERISVYGLKTRSFSQGLYLGDREPSAGLGMVALDPDAVTVDQGDSGGGIFGDDGALLGTINGYLIHSRPVTTMTPIVSGSTTPPVSSALSATKVQSVPPAGQSCPGGVCPAPQVQFSSPRRGFFRLR